MLYQYVLCITCLLYIYIAHYYVDGWAFVRTYTYVCMRVHAGRDFLNDVALQCYYVAFVSVDPELAGVSVVYIRIYIFDGVWLNWRDG